MKFKPIAAWSPATWRRRHPDRAAGGLGPVADKTASYLGGETGIAHAMNGEADRLSPQQGTTHGIH